MLLLFLGLSDAHNDMDFLMLLGVSNVCLSNFLCFHGERLNSVLFSALSLGVKYNFGYGFWNVGLPSVKWLQKTLDDLQIL